MLYCVARMGILLVEEKDCIVNCIIIWLRSGLEKLTNANKSVSAVNDRLFPVELMEIADSSISEYMLHSNFGQTLTRIIGGNFGAYTFILPLSLFHKYQSTFLDVLSTERILKQNRNTSEFPRTNSD